MNNYPTLTVTALNLHIKNLLEADPALQSVIVSGEISNFGAPKGSGHLYFTLKDETAAVKAVMFRSDAARLRFRPENGVKVLAVGRVSVFERDGAYQLYIKELIPDGAGALQLAFEQLRERLAKEGLFDPAHKKPLPKFPRRIGVITSLTGAVRRDIENVVRRRYPYVELLIRGVSVQGPTAAGEITAALAEFNRRTDVDVLIVARGGGSMEDLWCFNDETLARAVYDSRIPVISAVGHETDFTICDFVADRRAPTPSVAAELAVPDAAELRQSLYRQSNALLTAYRRLVADRRYRFGVVSAKRDFSDLSGYMNDERQRVQTLTLQIGRLAEKRVAEARVRLTGLSSALPGAAEKELLARGAVLQNTRLRLNAAAEGTLIRAKNRWNADVTALKQLNPLSVLLRGFAVVEDAGHIRSSVRDLTPGGRIDVVLADGRASCLVEEIQTKEGTS